MSYTINRVFENETFNEIVTRTRIALATQGFGILTEIDVKQTLKTKLDEDIADYLILGACNPKMAHQAMLIEPRVGAMLPCNVIVRSTGENSVEVSAIDPLASMEAIDNPELKSVAGNVKSKMESVVSVI